MELGAIGLICARISEQQLHELEAINAALEDNLRLGRSTIKNDIEFHTALLRATQNPVLVDLILCWLNTFGSRSHTGRARFCTIRSV